jgi:hypothetical protein
MDRSGGAEDTLLEIDRVHMNGSEFSLRVGRQSLLGHLCRHSISNAQQREVGNEWARFGREVDLS